MKWLKHSTDSLAKNSFMFDLIDRFGGDGYMVFFGTLEAMADEFNIHNPGENTFSIRKLTRLFMLSRQKTVKIWSFCDQKAKESHNKHVAFFASIDGDSVRLSCPKLKDLCDNWTKKQMGKLRSNSVATPTLLPSKEEEEEEEEEYTPDKSVVEFVDSFISFIEKEKKNLSPKGTNLKKNSIDSVEKLIRIDKFSLGEIRKVMAWAVKDEFWSNNVLSLAGLRKKSDGVTTKFQKIALSFSKGNPREKEVKPSITCPKCSTDFKEHELKDGKCPVCKGVIK